MSEDERWLQTLSTQLTPWGLNHLGIASVAAWDALSRPETHSSQIAPGARSIVVVASGGGALWTAMMAACREDPEKLLGSAHPLDAFTRQALQSALSDQELPWFTASHDAELPLDFRSLAVLAGLGAPSRLGLVLDEHWGPWMGLRAAIFVPHDLPPNPRAPDLCKKCPAPCESACPGGAFANHQWSVERCSSFHLASPICARSCVSREACPVGSEHRYSDLELLYHYNRSEGRTALRGALGIDPRDDPHTGSGPYWKAWSRDTPD